MLAVVLASFGMGLANAALPLSAQESWRTEPPMHYARAAHAVVGNGNAIYALAGTGAGGAPVLVIERFDGKTWHDDGTIPGPGLNAPAAVALGGKIYLIGGFGTDTNVPSDGVLVYDTTAKTWSRAAPLPAPRGGHAAIVLAGKIHVLGGGNSKSTIADHDVFDPMTNTWTGRCRHHATSLARSSLTTPFTSSAGVRRRSQATPRSEARSSNGSAAPAMQPRLSAVACMVAAACDNQSAGFVSSRWFVSYRTETIAKEEIV